MPNLIFDVYFASVIFGTVSCFGIGSYVFLRDSSSRINKYFFLFCLACGIFAGGEAFGIWQGILAQRPEKYLFWSKINTSGGWLALPLVIYLVLALTKRENFLKSKLFLIYLWLPTLILIGITTFTSSLLYIKEGKFVWNPSFLNLIALYSLSILLILGYFLYSGYKKVKSAYQRNQLKYLVYGLSILLLAGVIFFLSLPLVPDKYRSEFLSINFLASSLGISMLIIGTGILKYGTFINFRLILDSIFKKLSDLIIITDKDGAIILVNDFCLSKLKYTRDELIEMPIVNFLKNGKLEWENLIEKIRKDPLLKKRMVFLTRDKEETPFLVTFSLTKREIILVGKDIREMVSYEKKLEGEVERKTKELQERVNELERFHKLTIGRELKMVELKEEIGRLKKELEKSKGRQ